MFNSSNKNYSARELNNLKKEYDNSQLKRDELNALSNSLDIQLSQLKNLIFQNMEKIFNLENEIQNMNQEYEKLYKQKISETIEKSKLQQQLGSFKSEYEKIKTIISQLRHQLSLLEASLKLPAPRPTYRIDGEYCINGIHNCTNHPPRRIITNQDEIDRFEKKKHEIQNDIQKVRKKISDTQIHLSNTHQSINELQLKLQACINNINLLEANLCLLKSSIENEEILLENTRKELIKLKHYQIETSMKFNQTQNDIAYYADKLKSIQSRIDSFTNDNKERSPNNSNNLDSSQNENEYSEIDLAIIAMHQLLLEGEGESEQWKNALEAELKRLEILKDKTYQTAKDLWPSAGITLLKQTFKMADEIVGNNLNEPTNNYFVDEMSSNQTNFKH